MDIAISGPWRLCYTTPTIEASAAGCCGWRYCRHQSELSLSIIITPLTCSLLLLLPHSFGENWNGFVQRIKHLTPYQGQWPRTWNGGWRELSEMELDKWSLELLRRVQRISLVYCQVLVRNLALVVHRHLPLSLELAQIEPAFQPNAARTFEAAAQVLIHQFGPQT